MKATATATASTPAKVKGDPAVVQGLNLLVADSYVDEMESFPVAGYQATASFVEGPYRFEVIEGVSHWIAEEVPERVNELLLAHIGSS